MSKPSTSPTNVIAVYKLCFYQVVFTKKRKAF